MGLFGKIFGKEEKKESCCCEMEIVELSEGDTAAPCDCGDACAAPGTESTTLTVLGPGCKRCHQLHENAQAAASKADGSVDVEYVTDPVAIAEAGICSTPVLIALLAVVASSGSIAWSAVMLVAYSVGHSILAVIAGTSTGFVKSLSESKRYGRLSNVLKYVMGAVIALIGIYLIYTAL